MFPETLVLSLRLMVTLSDKIVSECLPAVSVRPEVCNLIQSTSFVPLIDTEAFVRLSSDGT